MDRLVDMGFHSQVEVTGLQRAGLRATGLKVRRRGRLTADMGISEMGTKLDRCELADWN